MKKCILKFWVKNRVFSIGAILLIFIFTNILKVYSQLRARIYTGNVEYEVYSTDFYNIDELQRSTFILDRGLYQRGVVSGHDHVLTTTRYLNEKGEPVEGLQMTGGTTIPIYDPMDIGAVFRIVPEPLPTVVVDGKIQEPLFPVVVDPNQVPGNVNEMTIANFSYPPGLRVTVKNYAFYNSYHSNYVLSEISVQLTRDIAELTGSPDFPEQTVEGISWATCFAFGPIEAGERTQDMFDKSTGDEWAFTFKDPVPVTYPVIDARNELYISYTYDDDNPYTEEYDVADPSPTTGELLSAAVPGMSFLYADKEPSLNPQGYEMDDPSQPYSVGWFSYIYHNRQRELGNQATIPGVHLPSIVDNPDVEVINEGRLGNYQTIGPYTIDQDYKMFRGVYAMGCAAISRSEAVSLGEQWLAGTLSKEDLDKLVKVTLRDSLVDILSRANWAFGRTSDGKERFTVPPAPPAPDIIVTSGDHSVVIEWEDVSSQIANFVEYRVYRAKGSYRDEFLLIFASGNTENPYITKYVDRGVVLGNQYYYYVTVLVSALDLQNIDYEPLYKGEMESNPFINRTIEPAIPMDLGKETVDDILVVPNPWHIRAGAYNYGTITDRRSNNQLTFVNLPPYCKLRIYTLRGELIFEKMHTSGSGTDIWDQITVSNQEIASGIYMLHVSEAAGLPAPGQNQTDLTGRKRLPDKVVKFIVVR